MKLMNVCLIALTIAASYPARPLHALSHKPVLIGAFSASCALISGVTAAWAHRKVKQLEALSDFEKNKPETKKALSLWKDIRISFGTLSFWSGLFSARLFYTMYQQNQRDNTPYKNRDKATVIKEKMKKQREAAKKREQEKATQKNKDRNGTQIKNQESVIQSIAPLLIDAAKDGNIAEIENLANQCQGEAQANLLNTRDAQGNTAWYYARQNSNQLILEYAREKAAQTSNFICGMCKDDESRDKSQYVVGSPSYNCLHFFHKACINGWHETHHTCPACRRN